MGTGCWLFMAVVSLVVLGGGPRAHAQPSPPPNAETKGRQTDQRQPDLERLQEQQLEQLKTVDPEAYQGVKTQYERQKQIRVIVTAFTNKQLDVNAARARLKPLVQAELGGQENMLDVQIAMLRQQLEELEDFRRDPAAHMQRQVDRYLGLVPPPGMGESVPTPAGQKTGGEVLIKQRDSR